MSVVNEIVSRALASNPCTTRTTFVQANFDAFKRARCESVFSKIVSKAQKAQNETDTAVNFQENAKLLAAATRVKPYLSRLDNKEIIARSTINEWFKLVKDKEAVIEFCGTDLKGQKSDKENIVYRRAAQRSLALRAENLVFRIEEELTLPGYPVFWTLTVEPRYEYIIAPRRDEFRLWLRKVERNFGKFRYCCVVERGAEGHLHMHCLFIFEECRFTDPNAFRPAGAKACPEELRVFWPYGWSDPVAVRYTPGDIYGSLGWRWPVGRQTGHPSAVARYMAEYLNKPTEELNGCRTKMTRGFGLFRLETMTLSQALMIACGNLKTFETMTPFSSKPPAALVKSRAARIICGKIAPPPLPKTRTGSVSQAAEIVTRQKSSRMNVGDSVNRADGSEWELNKYRKLTTPHSIGRM